ncbi:MAG TPA: HAMP domain-containing sensor histidine kinase, partial [Puia sp.]|nr:HAMP domain-containing sensor histidine kinase [Puia sp.]
KHLNELLQDFLSLGKLEEGRIRAEVKEFNAREFILETVDEMKAILKEGQNIQTDYAGADMVLSDKLMLKNILINLLGNASKFSGNGSIIWLTIRTGEEGLVLTVKDEGIGISEEDQQHLFSSFFRAKNVVNIEGTGLGLHIVKRYVELLEGSIELESRLNEGTSVRILLPKPASQYQ